MHRCHGITLVELLVVVALTATLIGIAVPGFTGLMADARRTAAVNGLVRAVHTARVAAATRGVDVVICRSRNGRQCQDTGRWDGGYLAFANLDRDQPPRVDALEPVLLAGDTFPRGSITANRAFFVLRPHGRRSVNGTFLVCDPRGLAAARVVVISTSGRPRTAAAADSPSPVNCPA